MGQRIKFVLPWLLGVVMLILASFGPKGSAFSPATELSPAFPSFKGRAAAPHSTEGQGPTAPHLLREGTPLHPPTVLPKFEVLLPTVQAVLQPATSPAGPEESSGRTISTFPTVESPAPEFAISARPAVPPIGFTSPGSDGNRYETPTAAPSEQKLNHSLPVNFSQPKGTAAPPLPAISPAIHGTGRSVSGPAPQKNLSGPAISPSSAVSPDTGKDKHRLPIASSPNESTGQEFPKKHFHEPAIPPVAIASPNQFKKNMPAAAPPTNFSAFSDHANSSLPKVSTTPAIHRSYGMPVAAPPNSNSSSSSRGNHTNTYGSLPARHLAPHGAEMSPDNAHAPLSSHYKAPSESTHSGPSSGPVSSFHHWPRQRTENPVTAPSYPFVPPEDAPAPLTSYPKPTGAKRYHSPSSAPAASFHHGFRKRRETPALSPFHAFPPRAHNSEFGQSRPKVHSPESHVHSPSPSPIPFHVEGSQRVPAPSPSAPSIHHKATRSVQLPALPPKFNPQKQVPPQPQPIHALPPPPPNIDCTPLSCPEPLTNSPPGSPCACVLPINVELRLSIALYTFFRLVSDFAEEIAFGVLMKQSQVRIMGANAANEKPEKTIVLLDLVPLGEKFDKNTAFFVYERFWHKKVFINSSLFGDYSVLYVRYPGLPESPPAAPGNINGEDGISGNGNNPMTIHPFAVDVRKHKEKRNAGAITTIVFSAVIALILGLGAACLLVFKCRSHLQLPASIAQTSPPLSAKASGSGIGPAMLGSKHSFTSTSFSSSIATYTGLAKNFSLPEMEGATNKFDDSRIIGEGGFGRVYEGTLEDGTRVAIKVLKRDDQQGSREFLAEVEMLGRLHHRNLIKLIGICTEESIRCLVYEFVPNGSVESHLHGADKEAASVDWNARLKIALGAARGLAYLHEDSSPRVIHRDFKSSNILLEEDFTPKVSDFGLARTALDEGKDYISTRVIGTFGYVAPEYAMTGHLLVKSDVYSYGVVLLELLTGRKPVDMLRPPGQENLVTWARPLLTSKDGLESLLDPSLGTDITFDSVAKIAAIASMCVQPEVSQRPFMGEVVQALRLVCSEEDNHGAPGSFSRRDISTREKAERATMSDLEVEGVLSASDIFATSPGFLRDASGSFRRYSGASRVRPGSNGQFWHATRGESRGFASDRGGLGKGSGAGEEWI